MAANDLTFKITADTKQAITAVNGLRDVVDRDMKEINRDISQASAGIVPSGLVARVRDFFGGFRDGARGAAVEFGGFSRVVGDIQNRLTGLTGAASPAVDELAGVAGALGPIGVAAGVAATAVLALEAAFVSLSISTARSLEELDEAADLTGEAASDLFVLREAANLAGVSFDQVTASIVRFQAKNPGKSFIEVGTAIASIEDPAERSAAAIETFGRAGVSLVKVFQELAQNKDLFDELLAGLGGAAGLDQAIANAAALTRELDRLKLQMLAITLTLTREFIPALTVGLRQVGAAITELNPLWRAMGAVATFVLIGILAALTAAQKQLTAIGEAFSALSVGDFAGAASAALRAMTTSFATEFARIRDEISRTQTQIQGFNTATGALGAGGEGSGAARRVSAQIQERLRELQAAVREAERLYRQEIETAETEFDRRLRSDEEYTDALIAATQDRFARLTVIFREQEAVLRAQGAPAVDVRAAVDARLRLEEEMAREIARIDAATADRRLKAASKLLEAEFDLEREQAERRLALLEDAARAGTGTYEAIEVERTAILQREIERRIALVNAELSNAGANDEARKLALAEMLVLEEQLGAAQEEGARRRRDARERDAEEARGTVVQITQAMTRGQAVVALFQNAAQNAIDAFVKSGGSLKAAGIAMAQALAQPFIDAAAQRAAFEAAAAIASLAILDFRGAALHAAAAVGFAALAGIGSALVSSLSGGGAATGAPAAGALTGTTADTRPTEDRIRYREAGAAQMVTTVVIVTDQDQRIANVETDLVRSYSQDGAARKIIRKETAGEPL